MLITLFTLEGTVLHQGAVLAFGEVLAIREGARIADTGQGVVREEEMRRQE